MAKSVLDALKATGAADLQAAIDAVSANMFKIKETLGFHASRVRKTSFRSLVSLSEKRPNWLVLFRNHHYTSNTSIIIYNNRLYI